MAAGELTGMDAIRLRRELQRLESENARLSRLLDLRGLDTAPSPEQLSAASGPPGMVTMSSPVGDKLALFADRFEARTDVYAVRWENRRSGAARWMPAVAGGWRKGMDRRGASYLRLDAGVIEAHLVGTEFIGLYPLLAGNTCRFLVADFDGPTAMLDALAYAKAARAVGVPAAVEISQSGRGAHVWVFFAAAVPAALARTVGTVLIHDAMVLRGSMDLRSYDRLFPSQDVLPDGGFGNLIAAPLQGRRRRDGSQLPAAALATFKHAASMVNPKFYELQRLRKSTWDTPRFVRGYDLTIDDHLVLPRGLRHTVTDIVERAGSRLAVTDSRNPGREIDVTFAADLAGRQSAAVSAMLGHDDGVLVAPPGSGKTVMACSLIAERATSTLVLVDRKALAEQWRARIEQFLGTKPGQIGGGRTKLSGVVDIAMLPSLARRDDVADLTQAYGHVIVDECHHLGAAAYEHSVKTIGAQFWLGLTATPTRRDGLGELVIWQLGPIRHTIDDQAESHIDHGLLAVAGAPGSARRILFVDDHEALVLQGGMSVAERRATVQRLDQAKAGDGIVAIGTTPFIGEGFDAPALDTLFLAGPISYDGLLVQCAGRVIRSAPGKDVVEVHDYHDLATPVLAASLERRMPGYRALNFAKA